MDRISVSELLSLHNVTIVDIRNYYYYSIGHIPGAISIPYYNLLNNYSHYLSRQKRYYLYCETGDQSLEIVQRLNRFGYSTMSVEGGYQAYLRTIGG